MTTKQVLQNEVKQNYKPMDNHNIDIKYSCCYECF